MLVLYRVLPLELPGSTDCCQNCSASKGDTAVALGEQSGHSQKSLFGAGGCSPSTEKNLVYSPTCSCH